MQLYHAFPSASTRESNPPQNHVSLVLTQVGYVKGWGKVTGANEVTVSLGDGKTQVLRAKNILLATGSEPSTLPGVPVDEERIVTSTGALSLKAVPKKIIVIGGGVIGLEMGSVWGRLGAEVTVVEYLDRIVPYLDSEVRRSYQRVLEKQGFKFKLGYKVLGAERKGDSVTLSVEVAKTGAKEALEADVVLVAAGRRPYSKGLGLEVRRDEGVSRSLQSLHLCLMDA